MDIRRVVERNVRRYRIEAKLPQKELAAYIGVEQRYVSQLEAGKRNPKIVTIWHAAEAFGRSSGRIVLHACSDSKAKKAPKADHPNIIRGCGRC
jgi:transcriptional regulator with XRE-family HTH domain